MPRHSRPQPTRERTEQERELARQERERRRTGKPPAGAQDGLAEDGRAAASTDAPVPPNPLSAAPTEAHPVWSPGPEARATSQESEPAATPEGETPAISTEPPPASTPAAIPPEPTPAAISTEPPPAIGEEPAPGTIPTALAPAASAGRPPIPIPPPEPLAGSQGLRAASAPPPASHGVTPPGEPPRGRVRAGAGRSLPARAGALLALVAAIAVVWALVQSLHGGGHAKTVAQIAVVKVLIPEGKTRIQIAQIAAADGLTGSYRAASKRSPLLSPARYGAPRGTPDLEGFLFPATYDMDAGAPVRQLVDEQLIAFRQNFGAGEIRRAHELHVTPYQLLTIASMVEREAQTAHDRPLIAAVIYNRLDQGMPLGIDATIYYAVELQKGIPTYTQELTTAQLQTESPYNTRTHTGLPPTPISNPGVASIEAAAHPARVPFLYYVAAADGCGEQVFSTTYAQFERNAAAYRAAVKSNGGHPPTCKSK